MKPAEPIFLTSTLLMGFLQSTPAEPASRPTGSLVKTSKFFKHILLSKVHNILKKENRLSAISNRKCLKCLPSARKYWFNRPLCRRLLLTGDMERSRAASLMEEFRRVAVSVAG